MKSIPQLTEPPFFRPALACGAGSLLADLQASALTCKRASSPHLHFNTPMVQSACPGSGREAHEAPEKICPVFHGRAVHPGGLPAGGPFSELCLA